MPQIDYRARLQAKSDAGRQAILGPSSTDNILFPLWSTNGVLFPYTPSVSGGYVAEYQTPPFVHSIYGFNSYSRSYPKPISLSAEFTAQSNAEALYVLAVLYFFKSVTKSYFGINPYQKAGTPPPVLLFNYLGEYQYNNVPVIIKEVNFNFPADIDYVPVNTSRLTNADGVEVNLPPSNMSGWSYVPTHLKIDITMDTQYIPIKVRNEFNLDEFRQGKLLNKGYI
jgi:hypothetical protein